MYNAPAVNYPVGRSRFQGLLFLLLLLGSAAVGLNWLSLSPAWGWQQTLWTGAWWAAAITALRVWRRPVEGQLCWDGLAWSRTAADSLTLPGQVAVRLDFQVWLLLEFRPQAGPVQWLWLERGADARRWHALRRALCATPERTAVLGIGAAGS